MPRQNSPNRVDDTVARAGQPPRRRRRTWPFVLILLLAWGAIFGGIFFSRFL